MKRTTINAGKANRGHLASEKELIALQRLRISEIEINRLYNSPNLSIYTNIEWREPKRVYSPSRTTFHLVQLRQNYLGEFEVYVGGLPLEVFIRFQNRFSLESRMAKSEDSHRHPTLILYHGLKDMKAVEEIVGLINENEHFVVSYYSVSENDEYASKITNLRSIRIRVTDEQLLSLPAYCTILHEIVTDKCYMVSYSDSSFSIPYDAVYVHGFPIATIGLVIYKYRTLDQLDGILQKYGAYDVNTEAQYHDWLKISFKCKSINLKEFYQSLREADIESHVFKDSHSNSFINEKREDYQIRLTYVGPTNNSDDEESIMSAIRNGHGEAYGLD